MSEAFPLLGSFVAAYLLGSIPFGLVLTRLAGAGDLRQIGSGNIGATNVLRTGRRGLAAATLLLDGAKGAAAVLLAQHFAGQNVAALAGLVAVLGHLFPVWLGFKGGKGVATGLGVLIAAHPLLGLSCGAIWIGVALALRISSASALVAFAAAPVLAAILQVPFALLAATTAIAALVFQRHRANIARLVAGTEPRFGAKQ